MTDLESYEFLKNSPIIEGNLFLQFQNQINLPVIEEIIIDKDNVEISEIKNFNIDASALNSKENIKSSIDKVGYRLVNSNNNSVIILRKGDVLVSMKKPYKGWESLEKTFLNTLGSLNYRDQIQSKFIGCRFVNKFSIGIVDDFKFEDYFNFNINFVNSYIPNINGYSIKFIHSKSEMQAKINFSLEGDERGDNAKVLFDIEITKPLATENFLISEFGLKDIRNFKNYIFHNSLTDKTLKLFR